MIRTENVAVLFISGTPGDTRRYRCDHQQEQLALQGVRNALKLDDDPTILGDVADYDLFILQRVPLSPLIDDFLDLADLAGKPAVFETDDLVFDTEVAAQVPLLDRMPPAEAARYRETLRGYARTSERCSFFLAPTEFLADVARRQGKQAFVNRNALSSELLRISENARQQRRRPTDDDRVIIGYFSGSGSHDRDFRAVTDALVQVMREHPHVWLHIAGELDLGYPFDPLADRIVRTPYLPWRELPHIIAATDINIVPLEEDSPFCQAKSELKYFEAGAVGVPTVATPVPAFQHAITHGTNGLLAGSPKEWRLVLNELVTDAQRRHALGEAARQDVHGRYSPPARAETFWPIVRHLLEAKPETRDPAELARAITARLYRHIERQDEQLAQQKTQIEGLRQSLAEREARWAHIQDGFRTDLERVLENLVAAQRPGSDDQ